METWDWCAEKDFLYAYLSYFGYRQAKTAMDGYWEAVARAGRDPNPYRAGFLQFVALAEDDDHAEELYADAALYFYDRCMHIGQAWVSPPGYSTDSTLRRGLTSQVQQAANRPAAPVWAQQVSWKSIVENGFILAGKPAKVAEQINELAVDLRIGHLMLLFQFGNLKKDTVLYNTRRFAEEVAPAVRHHFQDWEDRWWPKARATAPRQLEPVP